MNIQGNLINITLPEDYSPYPTLILCSNTLVNVPVPLMIYNKPVLLVGRGYIPLIWLSAPIHPASNQWVYILEGNKPVINSVSVAQLVKERGISISIGSIEVLRAFRESNEISKITLLDLRPIGLNLFGNEEILSVATNTLVGNTFNNVRVGLSLG